MKAFHCSFMFMYITVVFRDQPSVLNFHPPSQIHIYWNERTCTGVCSCTCSCILMFLGLQRLAYFRKAHIVLFKDVHLFYHFSTNAKGNFLPRSLYMYMNRYYFSTNNKFWRSQTKLVISKYLYHHVFFKAYCYLRSIEVHLIIN